MQHDRQGDTNIGHLAVWNAPADGIKNTRRVAKRTGRKGNAAQHYSNGTYMDVTMSHLQGLSIPICAAMSTTLKQQKLP